MLCSPQEPQYKQCQANVSPCTQRMRGRDTINSSLRSETLPTFLTLMSPSKAQCRAALYSLLFPLQHHHQTHHAQHSLLEPRVLTQQNGNVAHKRYESNHAPNHVFFAVEEGLARGVEFGVVCEVVVAFCEEAEGCFAGVLLVRCPYRELYASMPAPFALQLPSKNAP